MKTLNVSNLYEEPQVNVIELEIEGGITVPSVETKPFEPGD